MIAKLILCAKYLAPENYSFRVIVLMDVNATGTLAQVERRRRENRGAVGGEGWGLGRGCAPSQKIYEFFISKWCDENDSDLRYSEVPLKGKK